jgi:hypothetical protein
MVLNMYDSSFNPLKTEGILRNFQKQKWKDLKKIMVLSEGQETGAIAPAPENARKKI